MEIKVGIQHVQREITVESDASAAEVEAELRKALSDETILTLTDAKGRKVLVPVGKIAYVDLGQEHTRPVGFGAS
ncbi:MAG: DUF3107 domain-containing protein [Propionicimonas sp.]|uniref:DUF3107 domain-containing protein n=1 Tax=Propionicimonas sp. TaxID=1955623 RepID=UPI002B1F0103|nr:DUF3107 domain-containing protein [Propionicimonas sp.]MEA4944164.1 DUF3107 domain-containing protein [Propionicimonas sp.]MEA5053302.1 DUF3107 domain-containing protein [Propionicimonas sp.]MEA5119578.1 DUF3107 domain-containing protein [Propionicimonas sp.]